jgi:hypothetical protein
MNVL